MIDTNVNRLALTFASEVIPDGGRKSGTLSTWFDRRKRVYAKGSVYWCDKVRVEAITRGMRLDLFPWQSK